MSALAAVDTRFSMIGLVYHSHGGVSVAAPTAGNSDNNSRNNPILTSSQSSNCVRERLM